MEVLIAVVLLLIIISKQGVMTCVDITVMMKCMNIIKKGVKYTNGNEIVDTQGKLSTTLPTSPLPQQPGVHM